MLIQDSEGTMGSDGDLQLLIGHLYWFVKGCYSNLPKIGWLNMKGQFYHSSGGQKSKIGVSTSVFLLRAVKQEAVMGLSPWHPRAIFFLYLLTLFPLYVSVFKFPLLIRTPVGQGLLQ